jgi:DNA-binding winged helix-turn-helix (wHTH) protein/Tfp pilus assembly protein PilF/TolB-like protein
MFKAEKELYEFGEFRLDVTERFLARGDDEKRIPLSEKSFETLCVLVRNGGHLVSKKELLDQVWADSFVEENNLDKCIHAVRRALGEKPGEPKFIETVRKHGYRFIAEVRHISEEEKKGRTGEEETEIVALNDSGSAKHSISSAPVLPFSSSQKGAVVAIADWRHEEFENKTAEAAASFADSENLAELKLAPAIPSNENEPRIDYRKRFAALALVAVLAGAIALGYYFFYSDKMSAGGKKSIAVLPLKPINSANHEERYEIGIADSLIISLSSMKGFVVRPLSATRKYTDINQDPLAAGKEQAVDYVLASNYQIADGKLRITAQLFNVANGQIEKTYKSEKDAANLFAMQDIIAGEVGNLLLARFATTSGRPVAKRGTNNEEAYWLYLDGKASATRKLPGDIKIATEYFEKAIRLDPNYANAYAGLAYALIVRDSDARGRHETIQKARQSVAKALELDNNLAEAHAVLGEIEFKYDWDFAKAEKTLLRAVELDPNSELAHAAYGEFLSVQGRFDEAVRELKLALEINKDNCATQIVYGHAFYLARRYDEAIVQYKRVLEVDERFTAAFGSLWLTNEMKGDETTAFEWFMKHQKRNNAQKNPELIAVYQNAYDTAGWRGVWRKASEVNSNELGVGNYYAMARQAVRLGEKEKAFEHLNKALEMRQSQMTVLHLDPFFDPLRDDPRFDELVRRVGLN